MVLVGDPEQLQAIEAGAAFRALAERHGAAEITTIRRQHEAWQRDATRELATGRTEAALERYAAAGMVQAADTREAARAGLVAIWDAARRQRPEQSQVILAYTRDDVRDLNEKARAELRAAGELRSADQVVQTERGARAFAAGDRIMFQRNERGLGGDGRGRGGVAVKNGTLGTVLEVASSGERLTVRLDGPGGGAGEREGWPGGDVLHARLRAHRPRLCRDGAQGAGRHGGPGACAGDAAHGPACGLCRADPAPGRGGAALRPRGLCQPGGAGAGAGPGAGEGHQPRLPGPGR